MTATAKTCSKCGEVKGLDEFYRSCTGKLGRHAYCKVCAIAYSKARNPSVYAANRDSVIAKSVKWQKENADRYRTRVRDWYASSQAAQLKKRRDSKQRGKNPEVARRAIETKKALRDHLSDAYVKAVMIANGWFKTAGEVPSTLITLKREQLAIKRMARELKKAATKPTGENE